MKKLIVAIIGIIVVIVTGVLNSNQTNLISFVDNPTIEYGSEVDSLSFVEKVDGEIIDVTAINSYKVNESQTITYKVKKDNQVYEYDLKINIIDHIKPMIELRQDKLTISKGIKLDLSHWVHVYDKVDGDLKQSDQEKDGYYQIEANIDYNSVGNYEAKITARDINGNMSNKTLNVEVIDKDENSPYFINDILLVNKKYDLPSNYGELNDEAYNAVLKLIEAANRDGYDLPIISSYRSYDTQKTLYESYVARDGEEQANRYSAKPGTSEHQSGLAFDLASLQQSFGETGAGKWLAKHCSEYGFIIRYPQGKEAITGYMYEPWHVRYLGKQIAKDVYDSGLTLEEYLGV